MRVKRSCGKNKVYLEKSSDQEVLEACWELDEIKYGIPSPAKKNRLGIMPMTSIRQMDSENEEQHTQEALHGINKLKVNARKYLGFD